MFSKTLKQIASLSVSTTGSRILGLVRDATFFSTFGNSIYSSAFIIAFTIPNLFRRLLGEGALSSAFIPVFSDQKNEGASKAFDLLNQTLTRLLIYFGVVILAAITLLQLTKAFLPLSESWTIALPMVQMLLPYALLICLAAILTAALNCIGKFFIPSISPILLNLCMIFSLLLGSLYLGQTGKDLAYTLSFGVLFGGALQLILPFVQMFKNGWNPTVDLNSSPALATVKNLFLTATTGAAIIQINVLITRLIAYQVSDEAVNQLYISSRLTELPLGVFTVAIYTVIFPLLARHEAAKNQSAFSKSAIDGTVMMLGITVPATIGLMILAEPVLAVLFKWGRFTTSDIIETSPVLQIYAIGIPFYSLIAYFTRIFHAKQMMRTPVKISFISLLLNVTLSLSLMIPFGVKGLATANVLTATIQTAMLAYAITREKIGISLTALLLPTFKVLVCATTMGGLTWWISQLVELNNHSLGKITSIGLLFSTILGSAIVYGALSWGMGMRKYLGRT